MRDVINKKIAEIEGKIKVIDEEAEKKKTTHKAELKGLRALLRMYEQYEYIFTDQKKA